MNCREWEDKITKDASGKRIKKKQKTIQTRKSLPGPGDDSEDDFRPRKAVAKAKKAAEPKPHVKPMKFETGDDEDQPRPVPNKRAPKRPAKMESDSDVEMVDNPLNKGATVVKENSDSDTEKVLRKGKGKAREVSAHKRKRCATRWDCFRNIC